MRRARAAICTSATRALRCSRGCGRAATEGASCCASRISTPSAPRPQLVARDHRAARGARHRLGRRAGLAVAAGRALRARRSRRLERRAGVPVLLHACGRARRDGRAARRGRGRPTPARAANLPAERGRTRWPEGSGRASASAARSARTTTCLRRADGGRRLPARGRRRRRGPGCDARVARRRPRARRRHGRWSSGARSSLGPPPRYLHVPLVLDRSRHAPRQAARVAVASARCSTAGVSPERLVGWLACSAGIVADGRSRARARPDRDVP